MNQLVEELRAAIWSVWNRRWLALGVAWAICLAGWLVVALIPNSYESQARIFVQLDDVLAEQIGIGSASRERNIERVRQTLVSAVNLEKVVRSTRLGDEVTSASDMERAVAALSNDIWVVGDGSNVFQITAVSGRSDLSGADNAALAQAIVHDGEGEDVDGNGREIRAAGQARCGVAERRRQTGHEQNEQEQRADTGAEDRRAATQTMVAGCLVFVGHEQTAAGLSGRGLAGPDTDVAVRRVQLDPGSVSRTEPA